MFKLEELVGMLDSLILGERRAGTPHNISGALALESFRDELQNVALKGQNRKIEMTLPRTGI